MMISVKPKTSVERLLEFMISSHTQYEERGLQSRPDFDPSSS
jgi:hypothetical protein